MDFIVFANAVEIKRKVLNNLYIVDTNVLMSNGNYDDLLGYGDVRIPVEVLYELDNLKTNPGDRGFKARRAIRNVEKHFDDFKFLQHDADDSNYYNMMSMPVDDIIIGYCKRYSKAVLITNDISMKIKAAALGIVTMTCFVKNELPQSVTEVFMSDREYGEFKENQENSFGVLPGQFLCIKDKKNAEVKDLLKYLGQVYWDQIDLKVGIKNYLFHVNPKDVEQSCAINSLCNDEFTVIVGPAGTGKTLLSLAYCLKAIKDNGSRVHVFVNPIKTRDTEALGFYPGSRDEKLLQNFIGSVLCNKIGDMGEVMGLISSGSLNIYPFSDIRGIEIGKGDILYITEAQNLSIDLMKLAIQRCAEGSKIIIEGDPHTQVDKESFQDLNNGLKRVINVFSGDEINDFSYIYLPNIYRSRIAEKAEEM